MNKLIGQRVNASPQKALDVVISRFEAGDITGIVVSNNILSVSLLYYFHGMLILTVVMFVIKLF